MSWCFFNFLVFNLIFTIFLWLVRYHVFFVHLIFCSLIHLFSPFFVLYVLFKCLGSVILEYPSSLLFVLGIWGSLKYVVVLSNFLLRFFRNFCVSSLNLFIWLCIVLNLLFASFCEFTLYMFDIRSSMSFCSLSCFLFCFSSFLSFLFSAFKFFSFFDVSFPFFVVFSGWSLFSFTVFL